MTGLFHLCKGSCLCASSPDGRRDKVLYCYGEVVLQKPSLRPSNKEDTKEEEEVLLLYIIQMVVIALLLLSVLAVLLSIRHGVVKLKKQLGKLLVIMSLSSPEQRSNADGYTPTQPAGGAGVKDWLRNQPTRLSRSTSSYLPHNRNLLEMVEETSLLNNMT